MTNQEFIAIKEKKQANEIYSRESNKIKTTAGFILHSDTEKKLLHRYHIYPDIIYIYTYTNIHVHIHKHTDRQTGRQTGRHIGRMSEDNTEKIWVHRFLAKPKTKEAGGLGEL